MTIAYLAVYKGQSISECFLHNTNTSENKNEKEEMESKAVYVNKRKIRDDQNFVHLYENPGLYSSIYDKNSFGCQFDSKRHNVMCTCRDASLRRDDMRYFGGFPKQVYAYHGLRSLTDVGVGSVKALQRRKVKRIYLPETDEIGVGSEDLTSFVNGKNKQQPSGYYDYKKTSSKCIEAVFENHTEPGVSQKLSPIFQKKSATTSPKVSNNMRNIEIGSGTAGQNLITTGTQFEIEANEQVEHVDEDNIKTNKETEGAKPVVKVSEQTQKNKNNKISTIRNASNYGKDIKDIEKVFSSDSLVQHVHNLENPSDEKQSRTSLDPMENKLEREYRKMFTHIDRDSKASCDKPIPYKSASILKRRFEALRRGLAKKDDVSKNVLQSSQDSFPSRKDASVTSDPPSLEGRSYSSTKRFSPMQVNVEQEKKESNNNVQDNVHNSLQWPQSDIDSESQGVKGMFKLWGKKFNFEESMNKPRPMSKPSRALTIDINKKPQKESKSRKDKKTKNGRKFFFFKRKIKDNPKEKEKVPYKTSGVTAGRCEIADGLTLKLGGTSTPKEKISNISAETGDIRHKAWLKKFLTNTIESARSVNIRWNNSMYATSSSTVFELVDTIYKNYGDVLKSRSEISTEESSYYRSYTKNRVCFDQNIEAWMVPMMIPYRPKEIPIRIHSNQELKDRNIEVTFSDQKWFIEKSKAFANKIEIVLHSKNLKVTNKVSSEYLRIDIPKDFFDSSSADESKQNPTSDEEVYKIVEYESDLTTKEIEKDLQKGDHVFSDIKVIVSVQDSKNLDAKILETVIKRPPMQRDVVIQGSNVNIPKRCDVIGVGIITRRDLGREIRKPILKIRDDLLDDDSEEAHELNQKKCEFAESFLQDYYRHWTPLGIDLFSSCVSDSLLKSCSEHSYISFHNQGDGSRSCPNICDDFQAETIISSCNTSSCSQCYEETPKPDNSFSSKLLKKLKNVSKAKADSDAVCKRVLPKDSFEVFKRRKIYAASNKSKWACSEDKPVSVPSIESKGAQNTMEECPKVCKPPPKKKLCKKHVSMPDCETMNSLNSDKKIEGILAFKGQSGCDACKLKGFKCPKHAVVKPKAVCEIPAEPVCKISCGENESPPCSKPTSKQKCHIPPQPCKVPCDKPPPCEQPKSPSPKCSSCKVKTKKPSCNACFLPLPCESASPCKPASPCKSESPSKPAPPCKPAPPSVPAPPPPCPASLSPCESPSPPPNLDARRNAIASCSPPISPKCSKCSSPKMSHDCPSPVNQKPSAKKRCPLKPPLKREKRCPKCQTKLPCFKYPDCKLSSETTESSPGCSPQRSPNTSPGCSPPISPKASPGCSPKCSPKNSGMKLQSLPQCPKKKKPKKRSLCRVSPCNQIKKKSPCKSPPKAPCETDDFPWPVNNQVSNPPSPCCSATSQKPKDTQKCKKKCFMMRKSSNQSIAPKECNSDCAHKNTIQSQCCEQYQQTAVQKLPCGEPEPPNNKCPDTSKPKIPGIFLKMKPSGKKTCSKECMAWNNNQEEVKGVVRLNSHERITIKMKKDTPSTEEIREGMNIKVQDDDGKTLFERKDYTCRPGGHHRPSVLGDMYKDASVNRVSTPIMLATNEEKVNLTQKDVKSDLSLANLVEIQFKLRITQGDKTTEINIGNEDELKQVNTSEISKVSPEIYIAKNETVDSIETINEVNPKNDINIKIVIKNFKSNKIKPKKNYNDDFSKKISDKFHTVSTGYSDIHKGQIDDNVFSIHRATFDLASSEEKIQNLSKLSNEQLSEELTEPINFMVSSHSTGHLVTDVTEDENNEKSISSKKDAQSFGKYDDDTNEKESKDLNDTDQDITLDFANSNEYNDVKTDKKKLLKKVFEKVHNKPKNKENVRQLRDILKIILTDSSDNEIKIVNNELAQDVTYTSLKPNYFKDTDSMNNYYKTHGSSFTIEKNNDLSKRYPTAENNSYASSTSESESGCMCSRVAEKLNCDLKTGCCCRQRSKMDEITSCDLRNTQDLFIFNYGTAKYVNVETQNSKNLSNKSNSLNISIHNHENYSVLNEKEHINIHNESASEDKDKKESATRIIKIFSSRTVNSKDDEKKIPVNMLCISNDEKTVLRSEHVDEKFTKKKHMDTKINNDIAIFEAADVLQCYETKKAVLELYAEKTVTENGEHFVAKLPKFVIKDSEITRNFEQIANNRYKAVVKDVFMMSVDI